MSLSVVFNFLSTSSKHFPVICTVRNVWQGRTDGFGSVRRAIFKLSLLLDFCLADTHETKSSSELEDSVRDRMEVLDENLTSRKRSSVSSSATVRPQKRFRSTDQSVGSSALLDEYYPSMEDEKDTDLVYLDNAATTKMHREVLESIVQFTAGFYGNPHSPHGTCIAVFLVRVGFQNNDVQMIFFRACSFVSMGRFSTMTNRL